jgi:hypothetical protein
LGTHQCGLIDTRRLDRLHKPLHLCIVPDTKGMSFERMQVGQAEVDDLLFFGTGSITWRIRLWRDLRISGSVARIHGRLLRGRLALGLFVPRFGQLLLGCLFRLRCRLVTGGGKIHPPCRNVPGRGYPCRDWAVAHPASSQPWGFRER